MHCSSCCFWFKIPIVHHETFRLQEEGRLVQVSLGTIFSYWVLEVGWGASKSKWSGEPDFGSESGWQDSFFASFFWQTLNILSVICNLLSPFLQIHNISSIYLQQLFRFFVKFLEALLIAPNHCGLGCTFENIPRAANSHGILLFSDLLMMQFSKCIFHSDKLHLYSSDFISAVFWFPIWQNFNFYLQILWQSPELIFGFLFHKGPSLSDPVEI